MSRSSDRGQAEPLVAVVAVLSVCLALGLYAGVVDAHLDGDGGRAVASPALDAVERAVAPTGVARPGRIGAGRAAGPSGYATNVTLTASDRRWTAGPRPPSTADRATTEIGIHVGPTDVEAGRLEVRVW